MLEALIDLANELRDNLRQADQLTTEQHGLLEADLKTLITDMEACLK